MSTRGTTFADHTVAIRMRDLIKKIVRSEIDSQRPKPQYAIVDSIDRINKKCTVHFPGDVLQVSLTMGSIQPSAVGQVVRVEGVTGDRFVSDVIGVPFIDGQGLSLTPSYVGRRQKPWDAKDGLYNQTGTSMFTGRLKVTAAKGARTSNVLVIGSSTVAGFDSPGNDAWPVRLRDELERDGYPMRGEGTSFVGQAKAVTDPRWTFSGTVTQANLGLWATITNTSWAQYQTQRTCTNIIIHYFNTGGAFTYSIDGGAAVTITPTGASSIGVFTVTGLSAATHTIRITATTATDAEIISVSPVNAGSTGLYMVGAGVGGSATGNWTDNTFKSNLLTARTIFAPALVVVSIGMNDLTLAVPVSTFKTNLQTIIDWNTAGSSGSALVVMPPSSGVVLNDWHAYVSAMYDVAESKDVPLLDMTYRWHNFTDANTIGLFANTTHPNSKGHADYAHAARKLVS